MYVESLSALILRAKSKLYELGFKEATVERSYGYIWERMLKDIGDVNNLSIDDIYKHCESYYGRNIILEETYLLTTNELRIKKNLLELIYFKTTDQFHSVPMFKNKDKLDDYSLMLINEYLDYLRNNGLRETTIIKKYSMLSYFLKNYRIKELNDDSIIDYLSSRNKNNPYASRLEINNIKRFLIYLKSQGYIDDDFERLFPIHPINSRGSISSCYDEEEIKTVINYARSLKTDCAKRDLAILLIITYYGLRAKDVAELMIDNIDFDNSKIRLITSKTKVELEYNLFPAVGNAIVDYLLNERIKSKSHNIFINTKGLPIKSSVVTSVIIKLLKDSKINTTNKHYGPHSLRSSLATRMMQQNESIFTISKVLGHASIDTTKIYTKVDINHLKLCALEVPNAR